MLPYAVTQVVVLVMGYLHPLYVSYKVVSRKRDSRTSVEAENIMLRKMVVFWIVNAVFTLCEAIADIFITWLPLYNIAKVAFVYWMVHNRFDGANQLYERVIQPTLQGHEAQIDKSIDETRRWALDTAQGYTAKLTANARLIASQLMSRVSQQVAKQVTANMAGGPGSPPKHNNKDH